MASRGFRGILATVCAGIGAAVLAAGLLLAALHIVAYRENHYAAQFERLGVPEATRISMPDLMRVTRGILDYLRGGADSMQARVPIDGVPRDVFTQRELDHMVDVRDLMILAGDVMPAALLCGALLIALSYLLCPRGSRRRSAEGLLWGEGALVASLAALGLYGLIDFGGLFTRFHLAFFSNDLWILDPRESILINMVPQSFFVATAALIAAVWAVLLIVQIALSAWCHRCLRRRESPRQALALPGPARPELPAGGDFRIRTVGEASDPERSRYVIDGRTGVRPDAQGIFARFGLSDEDDGPAEIAEIGAARLTPDPPEETGAPDAPVPPPPAMRWFSPEAWGAAPGEAVGSDDPSALCERVMALVDQLEVRLGGPQAVDEDSAALLERLRSALRALAEAGEEAP